MNKHLIYIKTRTQWKKFYEGENVLSKYAFSTFWDIMSIQTHEMPILFNVRSLHVWLGVIDWNTTECSLNCFYEDSRDISSVSREIEPAEEVQVWILLWMLPVLWAALGRAGPRGERACHIPEGVSARISLSTGLSAGLRLRRHYEPLLPRERQSGSFYLIRKHEAHWIEMASPTKTCLEARRYPVVCWVNSWHTSLTAKCLWNPISLIPGAQTICLFTPLIDFYKFFFSWSFFSKWANFFCVSTKSWVSSHRIWLPKESAFRFCSPASSRKCVVTVLEVNRSNWSPGAPRFKREPLCFQSQENTSVPLPYPNNRQAWAGVRKDAHELNSVTPPVQMRPRSTRSWRTRIPQ